MEKEDSIELNNYYVEYHEERQKRRDLSAFIVRSKIEADMTLFHRERRDRIKELMFPLNDFSEIISSRLVKQLRKLGTPTHEIWDMRDGRVNPTVWLVKTKLDLLIELYSLK